MGDFVRKSGNGSRSKPKQDSEAPGEREEDGPRRTGERTGKHQCHQNKPVRGGFVRGKKSKVWQNSYFIKTSPLQRF